MIALQTKTRNLTDPHRDPVGLTDAVFDVSTMLFLRPRILDIENQFYCVHIAKIERKGLLLLLLVV